MRVLCLRVGTRRGGGVEMRLRQKWDGPWTVICVLGLGCVVVGISGQAVKTSEFEIAALTSAWSRIGLSVVGTLLLLLSLVEPGQGSRTQPTDPDLQLRDTHKQERARVRELQELLGLRGGDVDGIWGPKTRMRCQQQFVGSPGDVKPLVVDRLNGNRNRELVAWLQRQLNRRFSAGLLIDGLVGSPMHQAVVDMLGEADGVVGPRGYRVLTLE